LGEAVLKYRYLNSGSLLGACMAALTRCGMMSKYRNNLFTASKSNYKVMFYFSQNVKGGKNVISKAGNDG
jgi:hypothetical protein